VELTKSAIHSLVRDARLHIPEELLQFVGTSVGTVLEYVSVLQRVPKVASVVSEREPTMDQHLLRLDLTRPSQGDVLLAGAPMHEERYLVVPAVIVHETGSSHSHIKGNR